MCQGLSLISKADLPLLQDKLEWPSILAKPFIDLQAVPEVTQNSTGSKAGLRWVFQIVRKGVRYNLVYSFARDERK